MSDTTPPDGTGAWAAPPPAARPRLDGHRNGLGVAALVLGVVSLVLAVLIIFAPLAALVGLVAVIFGVAGIVRANNGAASNRGHAIAGLVTGLLALAIGVAITVSVGSFLATHATDLSSFGKCLRNASTSEAQKACAQQFADRIGTK